MQYHLTTFTYLKLYTSCLWDIRNSARSLIWSCNWNSRPGISILVHSKNILNNLKKSKMIGFKNKKDWSWTASNTCKIISLRNMSSKQKTYIWWWWRHQGFMSILNFFRAKWYSFSFFFILFLMIFQNLEKI